MRCRVQRIHDALSVVWGEISRLEDETDRLEKTNPVPDERDARIQELSAEVAGLLFKNKSLEDERTYLSKLSGGRASEVQRLTRENETLKGRISHYEKVWTGEINETHVSIPISAMSNVYVCWDKNDIFSPASMGYSSPEQARAARDRGVRKDISIARLVWME